MNDLNLPFFLAEFLFKSSLVVAIGFVLFILVRKFSPALKHRLWLRIFGASILIPLLMLAFPRWEILPNLETQRPVDSLTEMTTVAIGESPVSVVPLTGEPLPVPAPQFSFSWAWLLVSVWGVGSAILILRSIAAAVQLRKIERQAESPDSRLLETFAVLRKSNPTKRPVRLLRSPLVNSPFTWGITQPKIVLPTTSFSQSDLEMVLLHELEHVRRCDALAVLISRIFLVLNWINPLAWVALRETANLREEACDRQVLNFGHTSESYAEMLFRQAQTVSAPFLQTCATAVAETGTIEKRIKMILNRNSKRPLSESNSPWISKILTTLVLSLIATIGIVGGQKSEAQAPEKKAVEKIINKDDKLKTITIPSVEFADTPLPDAIAFLQQRSVELDPDKEGINIVLSQLSDDNKATRITLKLKNVPLIEAIRYTCSLAQVGFKVEEHAVVITPDVPKTAMGEAKQNGTIEEKLKAIVVPSIEFKDTPFTDAIKFLHQKSVELDAEKDPNKKGVNFVVKGGEGADPRITLKLRNVPLSEALRYTCGLALFEYKVESHSVMIRPKTIGK